MYSPTVNVHRCRISHGRLMEKVNKCRGFEINVGRRRNSGDKVKNCEEMSTSRLLFTFGKFVVSKKKCHSKILELYV